MSDTLYNTYISLLKDFIRFKSVSTDPAFLDDINKTADFLGKTFTTADFDVEIVTEYDNPLVLARYQVDPKAQTVMVYGHYDVQPAAKEDGWSTDPWDLTEKEGRLLARGAIDNKGQVMIHIATVLDLIQRGELKYNVTFFIEGNEETGSPNLEQFVHDYKEKLTSDIIIISDGEITGENPNIEVGFRGGINLTLNFKTSHTELHSGLYGGVVPNAAHEMSKFLAGLHKNVNEVQIPGFYDDVALPTQAQLNNNAKIPFDADEYTRITGTKYYTTESNYDVYTQVGLRPAIEVTGVESGYVGAGYKNGVPPRATAKINFRLVSNQSPKDILEKFKTFVAQSVPEYVDWDVDAGDGYVPTLLDVSDEVFETANALLADVYSQDVIYKYVGGGIPIVEVFQYVIGAPQLLIPLANEDCNMHGIDENFRIDLAKKGLEFSRRFFGK